MALKADTGDDVYMRRCIELALKGQGFTRPNPVVGSVIVCQGKIIGEGFHMKAGGPHAEVNAINSVADSSLLKQSTLYVTLEPCSHYGKTPPCADLIIEKGIKHVVAGTTDTTAKVAGRGFERLRGAGVEVTTGVLETECRNINRRFFTFHEKMRPYVILKWAQSADGFIDLIRKPGDAAEPNWITGPVERVLVHRWRAEEDALLVGGETVRKDNPALNVRFWSGPDPVKVIVTKNARLPLDSKIFDNPENLLLFTSSAATGLPGKHIITSDAGIPAGEILHGLYENGIQSVIIEGGSTVLNAFISTGLWDEARIFTGRKSFGAGVKAPVIGGMSTGVHQFPASSLEIRVNEGAQTMII